MRYVNPHMRTHCGRLIPSLVVALLLLGLSTEARAQSEVPTSVALNGRPVLLADVPPGGIRSTQLLRGVHEPLGQVQGSQPTGSRDSLKNGTVIGAVIGAVALGAFGAILCNALQEPGDPGCLPDTLRIAALGAAIGAGAGLAVDAARTQGPGVRVSLAIRF
jgi:hypothetical protein